MDRRRFVKSVGTAFFSLVVLNPGSISTTPVPGCSLGESDFWCGLTRTDQGCGLETHSSPGSGMYEDDESCGVASDPDNACGDCDDSHDTDQGCGQTASAAPGETYDSDELCGHPHIIGGTEDSACNLPSGAGVEPDRGCGTHDTPYTWGGTFEDPDQSCDTTNPEGEFNPDRDCGAEEFDASCGEKPGLYAADPDEDCGLLDPDDSCGNLASPNSNPAYDKDSSCGLPGDIPSHDAACGATAEDSLGGTSIDFDEACKDGNAPGTYWDQDQGCGVEYNEPLSSVYPDEDNACGGSMSPVITAHDPDDACGMKVSAIGVRPKVYDRDQSCGMMLWHGEYDVDNSCGLVVAPGYPRQTDSDESQI